MSNAMIDDFSFNLIDAETITTLSDGIVKSLINPMQYIKSCMFIPYSQSVLMQLGTAVTGIQIGAWSTLNVQARLIEGVATAVSGVHSISVPKHPQSSRGKYLNNSPFSNYRMLFEPFGFFEIPACDLLNASTIYYGIAIDLISGQCDLDVGLNSGLTGYYIAHKTAQLGIPIALTQITQNILSGALGVGSQIIGGITNAATGNLIGLAGNVSAALMDAIGGLLPSVTSQGVNGSFLVMGHKAQIHARFALVAEEDNSHNGRPLCAVRRLGDLSGMCICDKATIAISGALKDELTQITNFLESGFYIE